MIIMVTIYGFKQAIMASLENQRRYLYQLLKEKEVRIFYDSQQFDKTDTLSIENTSVVCYSFSQVSEALG